MLSSLFRTAAHTLLFQLRSKKAASTYPLHQTMLRNYQLASAQEPSTFKSHHWHHFPSNFKNFIIDAALWKDFRRNGITAGYDDSASTADKRYARHIKASEQLYLGHMEVLPKKVSDKQIKDGLIQWYRSLEHEMGRDLIKLAYKNQVGSPMHVKHDGKMLNVTDLDHLSFAWLISQHIASSALPLNPLICEIGAGFGGMACVLKRILPNARFILLDLPEVNCSQTYYVSKSFPDAKIIHYEDISSQISWPGHLTNYDFAILPGWCIERLSTQSVDLFINIRSMQEMNWTTLRYYFQHIHRTITPEGMFYCVNRYSKNTADTQPVVLGDYPFDDHWTALLSKALPRQKQIHQLVLKRSAEPNQTFHQLLSTLPR